MFAEEFLNSYFFKKLDDIWNISIGKNLSIYNNLSETKYLQNLELFKSLCHKKISKISKDKFLEPKLSIVGPTLEASKYFLEEENREMFANFIASSMNSDYRDIIHNSFIEIIKQLSSEDIKIFKEFNDYNNTLVNFILENENGNSYCFLENIYLSNSFVDYDISNLEKQGLIKISSISYIPDDIFCKKYYKSQLFNNINSNPLPPIDGLPTKLNLIKHKFQVTNLGKNFKNVCF
nr:DUF4393 domain-containing protein [uncultured Cetobacterium sp.]